MTYVLGIILVLCIAGIIQLHQEKWESHKADESNWADYVDWLSHNPDLTPW